MFNEYVDFEIHISQLSESRYAVSVSGPGGERALFARLAVVNRSLSVIRYQSFV